MTTTETTTRRVQPKSQQPPRLRDPLWAASGIGFTRKPLTFLREAHDTLDSDIIRFGYFGKTLYSVRGHAGTEAFFSSPHLDLKTGFVEIFGGLLPKRFIGDADDDLYSFSKHRSVFNFQRYVDAVRVSTDEVLRELGREGKIDLFDLSASLAFRASSRFMLGEPIMMPGFFGAWRELFFATNPMESLGRFQWNLLNPLFWRKQNQLFSDLEALLSRLIDAKELPPPGQESSYFDLGLNTVYKTKSREQAIGHIYMMFLAAFLNPSLSLGWVLADLLDPKSTHGTRVRGEISTFFDANGPAPAHDKYDQLELLQLCMMETMRLRIAAVNIRKVQGEPLRLGPIEIPVGAVVCNSPTFAHLSEEHYDRPNEYLPERWVGTPELERSTMTARFMPFGTFAHICPGKRFSHTWLKIAVAELFRRFDIDMKQRPPRVREGIMPVLGDRDGPCFISYRRK